MDVVSLGEHRLREALRRLPPPLDGVIRRAKRADDDDDYCDDDAAAQKTTFAPAATIGAPPPSHSESIVSGKGPQLAVTAAVGRQKAQIIGTDRSMTFGSSIALFHGGPSTRTTRPYPHGMDPNELRMLMGAEKRNKVLLGELGVAREAKYVSDVHAIAHLEGACDEALEPQADGGRLRLGRIPTQEQWAHSGELRRRNQLATWRWTAGFYVLCDGVLYEFDDRSLAAPIVNAWPVLGATCRRCAASSQAHPHALELRVGRYYLDAGTEALARLELAAPTRAAANAWVRALERAAQRVDPAFRNLARRSDAPGVDMYEPYAKPTGSGGTSARRRRTPRSATSPRRGGWGMLSSRRGGGGSARGRKKTPKKGADKGAAGSSRGQPRRGLLSFVRGGGAHSDRKRNAEPSPPRLGTAHDVRIGRRIVQHV